jgi:short-chain fatty acids transporter
MLRRLGHRFEAFFRATTPDPFVLAVGLTLVVFGLAAVVEGTGPLDIVRAWQGDAGFWSLLSFTMQMVLILVTGHALAATRPARALIVAVARLPRDGRQAAALVAFVSIACALVNWGLGLIVGALLAREVGRTCEARAIRAHYPLLVAAGYSGLMCWHGGFSGTAPLKMTTAADVSTFLGAELATRVAPVPFTDTVLGTGNLVVSGGLLLIVPVLCFFLAPAAGEETEPASRFAPPDDAEPEEAPPQSWPERIERSRVTTALIVVPLVIAIVLWVREVGISALEPNAINLVFLTAGLILHGSLSRYATAIGRAAAGAAGIILQFPFYAGIMGVMRTTGLARDIAAWLASHAPAQAYTVVTFLAAGLVNLFVPSGGGQWAVQGPVAVEAALDLGLPLPQVVMAVAYGDQWTNMLQPFWALPLLAITGIKAKDILGYTALFLIAGGIWMAACLYVQAS